MSADCITDLPCMVFFLIWPLLSMIGYVIVWLWLALYIFSVTEPGKVIYNVATPAEWNDLKALLKPANGTFLNNEFNHDFMKYQYFHVFHLFWSLQFIIYFTFMVLAGATAEWYFTPYTDGEKKRGEGPTVSGPKPQKHVQFQHPRPAVS